MDLHPTRGWLRCIDPENRRMWRGKVGHDVCRRRTGLDSSEVRILTGVEKAMARRDDSGVAIQVIERHRPLFDGDEDRPRVRVPAALAARQKRDRLGLNGESVLRVDLHLP